MVHWILQDMFSMNLQAILHPIIQYWLPGIPLTIIHHVFEGILHAILHLILLEILLACHSLEPELVPTNLLPIKSNASTSTCTGSSGDTPKTTNVSVDEERDGTIQAHWCPTATHQHDSPNHSTKARAMIDSGAEHQ